MIPQLLVLALIGTAALLRQKAESQRTDKVTLLPRSKTVDHEKSTVFSKPLAAMESLGKYSFERIAKFTSMEDSERSQQLASLSLDTNMTPSADERAGYRELGYALSALGIGLTSWLFYPPLAILGAPFLALIGIGRAQRSYRLFKEQGRFDLSTIDTLISIAVLVTGSFISGAMGYTIVAVSSIMLSRTQASSRSRLINIFGQRPRTAWVRVSGVEIECPIEEVVVGTEVIVSAGEIIPVDGVVIEGRATVDQQALTGESESVLCELGDPVLATTIIRSGRVVVRAERTGSATTAGQIGKMLEETSADNLETQLRGERFANASVVPTLILSGIALSTIGLSAALASLMASYGWSLRLLMPLSLHSFLTICSQRGILIKDARGLENLAKVDTVVFDKTGTLTLDRLHVIDIHCFEIIPATEVLRYAAAAEQRQSHPIARAILEAATVEGITVEILDDLHSELGRGITGTTSDGVQVRVGNERFMHEGGIKIPAAAQASEQATHENGGGLVMVAVGDRLIGGIEWRATLRPESAAVVAQLRQRGLKVLIISGDREAPTQALARELDVDGYHAEILPADKSKLIEAMQAEGRSVCFVGDGINDTLALRTSTVSISLSGATSAAVDTAQIILMDESLAHLNGLFEIAANFDANMSRNFATSVIPGVICTFGAFFLHMGFVSAIFVQATGIIVGIHNASGTPQTQPKLNTEQNNLPPPQ